MKFFLYSIKLLIAFFFSRAKKRKGDVMLISEKGNDARDNGYHLFLFIKNHHPGIIAYYVITPDSCDRDRLSSYSEWIVDYASFRHCRLFWEAKYLVSTHLRAGHTPLPYAFVSWLNRNYHFYKRKVVVNIKHGITKDYLPRMHYKNTLYNMLVCGAYPEMEYFRAALEYPSSVAQYTGFCRYDRLMDCQPKRQILVMPTYRMYVKKKDVPKSTFLKTYQRMLLNEDLIALLEKNNLDLVFYLHHMFQPYSGLLQSGSNRIIIAYQAHYDVQQLLKDSCLLITDYSSVFFDFAYMKKPVVFYQFDYQEYRARHFKPGYFDYHNSFGPIVDDEPSLLATVQQYVQNGFEMEDKYKSVVDYYFPIRDQHNCERVFEAIMNC